MRRRNAAVQKDCSLQLEYFQVSSPEGEVGFEIQTQNTTADYRRGNPQIHPAGNEESYLKQQRSPELPAGASIAVLLRYQLILKSIPRFIDPGRKY